MGLVAARWGKQRGCVCDVGSSNFRGSGLPLELGGMNLSQTRKPSPGDGQCAAPSPPACLVCFAVSFVAPCGVYTSPLLSLQELWTQASDPKEPLAMNAVGPWKGFRTANQK